MNSIAIFGITGPVEIRCQRVTQHMRIILGYKNQIIASVQSRTSDQIVA